VDDHASVRGGALAVDVAVGLVRVRTNRGLVVILGNSSANIIRYADSKHISRTTRGAVLRRRVIRLGCGADLAWARVGLAVGVAVVGAGVGFDVGCCVG